jgi:ribonuclease HII
MTLPRLIAGVDEAGRGPLAGPVVAAALVLGSDRPPWPFRDSKTLTERRRRQLYLWLMENGVDVGIGIVKHDEIDRINILKASLLAMKKAVMRLRCKPEKLLIDGRFTTDLPISQEAVVKGDLKVEVISAASIVAKVTRDRIMQAFHRKYPQYGFDRHKGYPTDAHKKAILKHGPSPIHRLTFKGVKQA